MITPSYENVRNFKAKKDHRCVTCGRIIRKGERYQYELFGPWQRFNIGTRDDPEYDSPERVIVYKGCEECVAQFRYDTLTTAGAKTDRRLLPEYEANAEFLKKLVAAYHEAQCEEEKWEKERWA